MQSGLQDSFFFLRRVDKLFTSCCLVLLIAVWPSDIVSQQGSFSFQYHTLNVYNYGVVNAKEHQTTRKYISALAPFYRYKLEYMGW